MKTYYEAVITIAAEGNDGNYTVVHRIEYEAEHPSAIIAALNGDGNAIWMINDEQLVSSENRPG